jgi:hypothetical protein
MITVAVILLSEIVLNQLTRNAMHIGTSYSNPTWHFAILLIALMAIIIRIGRIPASLLMLMPRAHCFTLIIPVHVPVYFFIRRQA